MKTLVLAVASIFTALAPAAFAQDYQYRDNRDTYQERQWSRGRDSARVLETRPLYNAANSREECWNPRAGVYEEVRKDSHGNKIGKGTVIGAIAGGVVGHQFGGSSGGRDVGTGVGAIVGGLIGNQVDKDNNREQAQNDLDFSRCRMASQGGELQGYEVRYDYRGRQYSTRMDHDPGSRLVVGEDIRPDGRPIDPVAWR
jgi:uncharacterized protein YcfJ